MQVLSFGVRVEGPFVNGESCIHCEGVRGMVVGGCCCHSGGGGVGRDGLVIVLRVAANLLDDIKQRGDWVVPLGASVAGMRARHFPLVRACSLSPVARLV